MSTLYKMVALIVGADGLLAAAFGHDYMRWLVDRLPGEVEKAPEFFLRWPEKTLRLAGFAQALVGFGWFVWQLFGEDVEDAYIDLETMSERLDITP